MNIQPRQGLLVGANALVFLVEIAMLVAYGLGCGALGAHFISPWIGGSAGALAVAALWGNWLAPKARWRLARPSRIVAKTLLFIGAVGAALYAHWPWLAGFIGLGGCFALLVEGLA